MRALGIRNINQIGMSIRLDKRNFVRVDHVSCPAPVGVSRVTNIFVTRMQTRYVYAVVDLLVPKIFKLCSLAVSDFMSARIDRPLK